MTSNDVKIGENRVKEKCDKKRDEEKIDIKMKKTKKVAYEGDKTIVWKKYE